MKVKHFLILGFFVCLGISCDIRSQEALPILGKKKMVEGKEVNHTIPNWEFIHGPRQIMKWPLGMSIPSWEIINV